MPEDDQVIRVLIADDHPVVRQGLSVVLANNPDIEVTGEAKDIPELLQRIELQRPDVLVLDLDLQCDGEMGALKAVRTGYPETRIVVYTAHEGEDWVVEAIGYGVEAYVLKSANPKELLSAIRVVHRGGTVMQSSVASTLMKAMRRGSRQEAERKHDWSISARELDVLGLMAEGKSNNQIATKLIISERTVKFHVSSILSKLEVNNRTEAVLKATREGILRQRAG